MKLKVWSAGVLAYRNTSTNLNMRTRQTYNPIYLQWGKMHKFRQCNEMQAIVILAITIKHDAFGKVKSLPTGKLMSALLSGLTDRNSVVQKSFAFAMGHLVRVSWALVLFCFFIGGLLWSVWIIWVSSLLQTSRDSSTEKLLHKLSSWYMEKEGMLHLGYSLTEYSAEKIPGDSKS